MKLFNMRCRHDWKTHWYDHKGWVKHYPHAGRQKCRKCAATRNLTPMCMPTDEARGK